MLANKFLSSGGKLSQTLVKNRTVFFNTLKKDIRQYGTFNPSNDFEYKKQVRAKKVNNSLIRLRATLPMNHFHFMNFFKEDYTNWDLNRKFELVKYYDTKFKAYKKLQEGIEDIDDTSRQDITYKESYISNNSAGNDEYIKEPISKIHEETPVSFLNHSKKPEENPAYSNYEKTYQELQDIGSMNPDFKFDKLVSSCSDIELDTERKRISELLHNYKITMAADEDVRDTESFKEISTLLREKSSTKVQQQIKKEIFDELKKQLKPEEYQKLEITVKSALVFNTIRKKINEGDNSWRYDLLEYVHFILPKISIEYKSIAVVIRIWIAAIEDDPSQGLGIYPNEDYNFSAEQDLDQTHKISDKEKGKEESDSFSPPLVYIFKDNEEEILFEEINTFLEKEESDFRSEFHKTLEEELKKETPDLSCCDKLAKQFALRAFSAMSGHMGQQKIKMKKKHYLSLATAIKEKDFYLSKMLFAENDSVIESKGHGVVYYAGKYLVHYPIYYFKEYCQK